MSLREELKELQAKARVAHYNSIVKKLKTSIENHPYAHSHFIEFDIYMKPAELGKPQMIDQQKKLQLDGFIEEFKNHGIIVNCVTRVANFFSYTMLEIHIDDL